MNKIKSHAMRKSTTEWAEFGFFVDQSDMRDHEKDKRPPQNLILILFCGRQHASLLYRILFILGKSYLYCI